MLRVANIIREDRNNDGAQAEEESKDEKADMNVDFRRRDENSNVQREPLVKRRFAHSRRQHSDDEGEKEQDPDLCNSEHLLNFWIYSESSSFFDIYAIV